jgi:hypothetical protein
VGLKDIVERLAGKRPSAERGSRGPREHKRDRDESTIQVQSPIVTGSNPPSPMPPVAPPAPVPPAAVPPSSAASAPVVPPVARPATPPPAPAPSAPQVGSADKTQYVTIPAIDVGQLVGVLVGLAGELEGQIFKLFDGDCKLGRSESCDVVLLDPKVSREHAKILTEGGEMVIIPLSDKNPVYVNDEQVEEADQLSDGDLLRLGSPGSSIFRFRTIEGL